MANELIINYPTGATLYALLFDATGQIYNGSTFGAPGSASWTDYDIAMSEAATATGIYRASMPAVAAGSYGWVVRKQAGASPAVGDASVGAGKIEWSGTAEVSFASEFAALATDSEIASAAATAILVTPANKLATGAGGVASANVTYSAGIALTGRLAQVTDLLAIGGTSTYSYSNTVDDGSGNLLDGVFIQCATDAAFTNIVSTATTNSLGAFTVYDDVAGTHYLRLQFSGITFTDQTVTLA